MARAKGLARRAYGHGNLGFDAGSVTGRLSREGILAAARAEFVSRGYDAATIRGIAATAGVDPALVRHCFGSKQHLFVVAPELPVDPAEFVPRLLDPGIDGLSERITARFLEAWDTPGGRPFLGLLRSVASNEQAAEALRLFVTREVLERVAALLVLDRHSSGRLSPAATSSAWRWPVT